MYSVKPPPIMYVRVNIIISRATGSSHAINYYLYIFPLTSRGNESETCGFAQRQSFAGSLRKGAMLVASAGG